MKINADAVSKRGTLSEQDRAAPVKDSTTPTPLVPSISSIVALNEPKVWTSKRRILVSAVLLLLLALSGFLNWLGLQKAASNAQFDLDLLYYDAERAPKDLGKAAELFQKAADQGNAEAQNNLGLCYENGEGVPKDLGKAAELWQKAADRDTLPRSIISACSTKRERESRRI